MTTASGVALHGRHLNEVSASTVGEFAAAVNNSAVDKILLAAGTYKLTSTMCWRSAVCIDRALTIEAGLPGTVVLNATGARRVFHIQSGGTVKLIGLNITGGYVSPASVFAFRTPQPLCVISSSAPMERYVLGFGLQGGGLYIEGTATLTNTNVYSNQASGVRSLSALA